MINEILLSLGMAIGSQDIDAIKNYTTPQLEDKVEFLNETSEAEENSLKRDILNFYKTKLNQSTLDSLIINYNNLINPISNISNIDSPNTKKFEKEINWFLKKKNEDNPINYVFHVIDTKNYSNRKLNMLLKITYITENKEGILKTNIKYESMYLPIQ